MSSSLLNKRNLLKSVADHLGEVQLTRIFDIIKAIEPNVPFHSKDETGSYIWVQTRYRGIRSSSIHNTDSVVLRGSNSIIHDDGPARKGSARWRRVDEALQELGEDGFPRKTPVDIFGPMATGGFWDGAKEGATVVVEADDMATCDEAAACVYFSDIEPARSFASFIDEATKASGCARSFRCVWVSEWGTWTNRLKHSKDAYIYTWWSQGLKRQLGKVPMPGLGIPRERLHKGLLDHLPYKPA